MRNVLRAGRALGLSLTLVWSGTAIASGVQEFHAYLLPDTVYVDPDSVFTVGFWVDSTAQQFNGYEITIQWDPAILEYVSATAGPLFEEPDPVPDCGSASYSTVVFTSSTDSTVHYEHVILCADYSANGPGLLSTFEFVAAAPGVSALAVVSDPDRTFLDAGLWIWPGHGFPRQVVLHDAVVVVEDDGTGAGDPGPTERGPALTFYPNPTRAGGEFRLQPVSGPVLLDVVDAGGRRILRRQWARAAPGTFRWSGRGGGGENLPAGVYFARLETPVGAAVRKLVLLR